MTTSVTARKAVSKWTAVFFLVTGVSGLILLFTHSGHTGSLSEAFIVGIHIHKYVSILFLVTAMLHITFNWKTLIRYFKNQ